MSKVILTVEQDKWIKALLNNHSRDRLMNYHGQGFVDGNKQCLNELLPSQMAKILYVPDSYEIERPKFEVGDWAFWNDPRGVAKTPFILTRASGDHFFPDVWPPPYCGGESLKSSELRHATTEEIKVEQERRWWAKLGRKVGEFKVGDVRTTKSGVPVFTNLPEVAKKEYELLEIKGFYPAESFKEFPKGDDS